MEVIDYFRILRAIIMSFFMNKVQNKNEKVLEEILAGSYSNAVKTKVRGPHNFQNDPPFSKSFSTFLFPLLYTVESINNSLVA